MELAKQIKQHRAEKGLSQEDLAAAIYVSRQTVSNWENDKTYPDVQSLLLLSNLFGVSIDSLVKGDVKVMEEIVETETKVFNRYNRALGVLYYLMLTGMPAAAWAWGMLAGFVWLLVWTIPTLTVAFKVEQLKREHDLVTYAEVVAFSKGEQPVRDEDKRRIWPVKKTAMVVACAVLGAIAGLASVFLADGVALF